MLTDYWPYSVLYDPGTACDREAYARLGCFPLYNWIT